MLQEEHIDQLNDLGATVIPNVLSKEECDIGEAGFWNWIETFSDRRIKRDDKSTWNRTQDWPYGLGLKGIIQHYKSIIHSQTVWDIRQNPKIVQVFADLYGSDPMNLLCSFDGVNIQPPPESTGKWADPYGTNWQHMDQGPKKRGLCTIQGYVNLVETDHDDGCLIVRPGSHKYHDEFFATFPDFKDDWVKLTDEQQRWFDNKGCMPVCVPATRGSLTLWDSRCVHANSTATMRRAHPERFRMVVYVCMTDRSQATESNLKKKRAYFEEGRVTNHYPHIIKVFPVQPHLRGDTSYLPGLAKDKLMYQRPILTSLGMRLAGY
jgi:hypothetical protein